MRSRQEGTQQELMHTGDERYPPTNAEMSLIQDTTESFRTKILRVFGDITSVYTGLRADMAVTEDMFGTSYNAKVAADNKK